MSFELYAYSRHYTIYANSDDCVHEMRMVRWMCGIKLKDRLPSKELRERLGIDDITLVLQQNRLRWYGHVLRKNDDWMKKCMEYEV